MPVTPEIAWVFRMIVESLPADEKIERAGAPLRLLDKMPEIYPYGRIVTALVVNVNATANGAVALNINGCRLLGY